MAGLMYRNNDDPYSRNLGGRQNMPRVQSNGFFDHPESSYSNDDDVTYDLDHLATYVVAPHRGLSTIDDAFNRLRRMTQTSGVWTKRLKMRIGARDLVIVDSGEPIERFPLRLVGTPVSIALCDGYENVIAFSVASDELLRRPAEIHLFQCLGKPASDMANDIKAAKSGMPLQKRGENQPLYAVVGRTQEVRTTPQPPDNINRSISPESSTFNEPVKRPDTVIIPIDTPITTSSPNDVQKTAAERKALDLKMLDRCFSDIESFVDRLQKAARDAADPNKDPSQRIQSPEAKDFFEIFQKFKVSFILLSRLKQEIRDPNASELVHSLFVPLATVADASRDPNNKLTLASQVVSPLLTAAAVDLLNNCLSSKEMELLRSLGPAWITTRSKWTENIPPYILKFSNGQMAPKTWLDDVLEIPIDARDLQNANAPLPKNDVATGAPTKEQQTTKSRNPDSLRRQREYLLELQARGSKVYIVVHRRDANNPKELTVEVDDVVEVIEDTRVWWNVRNSRNETGFVPSNHLKKAS